MHENMHKVIMHNVLKCKRGYASLLPFLGLCLFFLVLCVAGLVFAFIIKDNGQKDVALQSVFSSGSILLDFAKLPVDSQVMYELASDKDYFMSVDAKPERLLFDSSMALATKDCYEAQWYLSENALDKVEPREPLTSNKKLSEESCPNRGSASVVLVPRAKFILRTYNSISSPIAGVSVR